VTSQPFPIFRYSHLDNEIYLEIVGPGDGNADVPFQRDFTVSHWDPQPPAILEAISLARLLYAAILTTKIRDGCEMLLFIDLARTQRPIH